jgi:hypothetical protein
MVSEHAIPSYSLFGSYTSELFWNEKKSTIIQKFREVLTSVAGQGQTLFLSVVENNNYQFSL